MSASDVLVLYMAGRNLGALAARLMRAGRDPADGVAVIRDATRPAQDVFTTTLREATDLPASPAPVLIVIGPVVALRDQLRAWHQTAPTEIMPHLRQAAG